ncbi:MAG: hypothetical protein JNN07_25610 [Verrucomicrobiales bacterium]|nr:hypothetical protein [Verrucomicrobiales bacterium]
MLELVVAMAILVLAVFPIAFQFLIEQRIVRDSYREAVVMEILDGEAEFLRAGAWKNLELGAAEYPVNAESQVSLPPGGFFVTRSSDRVRLDWRPDPGVKLRGQSREFLIP